MSSRLPDAIREHRVVEFSYEGRSRTVEPHAVGYDAGGELTLCGWQLSGKGQGFRAFPVKQIRLLTITAQRFEGPRPEYDPVQPDLRKIVCRL